jgi:hypothetical protein
LERVRTGVSVQYVDHNLLQFTDDADYDRTAAATLSPSTTCATP